MNTFSRRLLSDGEPLRQAFKFAGPAPQGLRPGQLERFSFVLTPTSLSSPGLVKPGNDIDRVSVSVKCRSLEPGTRDGQIPPPKALVS
jgi:hypothetical protein